MRQLIAGNWKMNGLGQDLAEIETVSRAFAARAPNADTHLCVPFTLIPRAVASAGGAVPIGAQDCSPHPSGAYTGDVSAEMLKDAGASCVIVGHSERRQYHHETNAEVALKAMAAWRAGLSAIICIGESEKQRNDGAAREICTGQVEGSVPKGAHAHNTAIAYEPIWAIGTGKTPTAAEIVEMHAHVRACLVSHLGEVGRTIRILYGGSVKPNNAGEILKLAEVGGALIGGASLKAADYLAIVASAVAART
jgi:triosephosphate isomerase